MVIKIKLPFFLLLIGWFCLNHNQLNGQPAPALGSIDIHVVDQKGHPIKNWNYYTNQQQQGDWVRYQFKGTDAGIAPPFKVLQVKNIRQNIVLQSTDHSLNGITGRDLILIHQHLYSVKAITGFNLLAADANMSGTVSAFDVIEFRKLILGTYTSLPFSNSWRFVDKNLESVILGNGDPFTELEALGNPNNAPPNTHGTEYPSIPPPNRFCTGEFAPFTLPSTLPSDRTAEFIGFKVGDVDFSSVPGFSGAMEDRSQNDWPMAQVAGQGKKGSMVEIPIVSGRAGKFSGWQMNLHYDARQMEVVDIIWATPEQSSNPVNRGWNIVSPGNIRLIWWDALTDFQAQSGTPICWLKVRLLQEISTEKPLFETSDEGMQSLLFDPNGTNYAISMGLTERSSVLPSNLNGVAAIAPLSVYPNPTSGHFRITMHSDKAQHAALTITDLSGKIMMQQDIELTAGDNSITSARLPQTLPAGQYEVQLKTNSGVQRVRLVKQ